MEKLAYAWIATLFVIMALAQAYHSGQHAERAEQSAILRESRMQAFDAGTKHGFDACQEQF